MIWVLIVIVAMFAISAVICIPDKLRKKGKK